MLVLSRKVDESIVVHTPDGIEIEFKIVNIRSGKVRVGVTAPKEVAIHRREVADRIRDAQ